MVDYRKELNSEQAEAVLNGDGATLVIAGPGSGKTRTVVFRICRILGQGAAPESVLLLTFTNKAAREMKERARKLIGDDADRITAGTFHHFANLLLRKHADRVGLKSNFTILDEQDAMQALKKAVVAECGAGTKKNIISMVRRIISLSTLRMQPVSDIIENDSEFVLFRGQYDETVGKIASAYTMNKRRMNALDFDDLLLFAWKLLSENEGVRQGYQRRFANILVDEFQDTDRLQAQILELLYADGKNLMVVGDDFQSIYSFRGAEIRNILEFKDKFGAKVHYLKSNYRSTSSIVGLVNGCMEQSGQGMKKELNAIGSEGELPVLIGLDDKADEAWNIAGMIEKDLKEGRTVGVLFRAAYFAAELETELTQRGIQYELRGGVKFFEQKHVKDMVALLKVFENPLDSSGVLRLFTLFPGIGGKKAESAADDIGTAEDAVKALAAIEKKGGGLAKMLRGIFSEGRNAAGMLDRFYEQFYRDYMKNEFDNWEERQSDIEALIGTASRFESVGDFLSSFSLDEVRPKERASQTILSTIHQAKGLEWDSVYIICAADGMLPIGRATDFDEERRLFYVAASRARKKLVMSYPKTSGKFYTFEELEPSRFIQELPEKSYRKGA
ncbi:MAG: ATP-dependent helicase [Candidatus Micrarchaeota archaeon]